MLTLITRAAKSNTTNATSTEITMVINQIVDSGSDSDDK